MKATLSSKGQITVPKGCRDRLGLKTGTVLDFEVVDGALVARKVQPTDPYRAWRGRGRLPGAESVDDYLNRIRG